MGFFQGAVCTWGPVWSDWGRAQAASELPWRYQGSAGTHGSHFLGTGSDVPQM